MKKLTLLNILLVGVLVGSIVLVNATHIPVNIISGPDEIPPAEDYDPFADVSGLTFGYPDGEIDMRDIGYIARKFGTQGNSSRNVTITNSNLGVGLTIKQMPLCRIYTGVQIGGSWVTTINATPPSGKLWYVNGIELRLETYNEFCQIELETKGVIQFHSDRQGLLKANDVFNFEFPAIIEFNDTESIIVRTGSPTGQRTEVVLCITGWEE